MKLITNNI